ncbi:MAG: cobyric acid synthase, partial [Gammaproteobacteria bacterium]|nr:cobyric acid synthase [Gammaproteobacteria bacterium]
CNVAASVHMNPILLKPQSDIGAQVVVQGEVVGTAKARAYQTMKATLMPKVLDSFSRTAQQADMVLVEGAGSASEVKLRAGDIANMGFALAANVPVVLIGDIDRGGVIASLCGTHELITEAERALVGGYLINKFRGDPTLFDSGIDVIGARTAMACHGVVPWFDQADALPAEDALGLVEKNAAHASPDNRINVAVLMYSRIANFDDLDPLFAEADVNVTFVKRGAAIPGDVHLVILPGSKSTLADLQLLRDEGWDIDLLAHVRRGGSVLGLCGGYQMLGHTVEDPLQIEGSISSLPGLKLLDVHTRMSADKTLTNCVGEEVASGTAVHGYEIHLGTTTGKDTAHPMLRVDGRAHGAVSRDGRVMGCYMHGIFASDAFRHAFLSRLKSRPESGIEYERLVDDTLDALAEHIETHVNVDALIALAHSRTTPVPSRERQSAQTESTTPPGTGASSHAHRSH